MTAMRKEQRDPLLRDGDMDLKSRRLGYAD